VKPGQAATPMPAIPSDAELGRLIREVTAAEILPRFRNLADHEVRIKSHPQDLVTAADVAAERLLTQALLAMLPGSRVVGEEATDADPGTLAWLGEKAPVWLVDPVDGTANFAQGRDCFAVVIALCIESVTVAGWIYDPVNARMVRARLGEGAWLEDAAGNVQSLRIDAVEDIAAMSGSLPYKVAKAVRANAASRSLTLPRHIGRLGSTGREYAELACGRLDFAVYTRLKPWDHAAGDLIYREAGGCGLMRGDALPYRPAPEIAEGTLLLASTPTAWRRLDAMLG
jgi:Archaeal fructose-1,6-bisphosphatase and related enzymes of inositol monophosphatase family